MADLNKKVSFGYKDDGLFSALDKAKQQVQGSNKETEESFKAHINYAQKLKTLLESLRGVSQEFYNTSIIGAKTYSESGKQQLTYLNMQLDALKKQNEFYKLHGKDDISSRIAEHKATVNAKLAADLQQPGLSSQQKIDMSRAAKGDIERFSSEQEKQVADQEAKNQKQIDLLQEIVDNIKLAGAEAVIAKRSGAELREEAKKGDTASLVLGQIKDSERQNQKQEKTWIEVLKGMLAGNLITGALKSGSEIAIGATGARSGEEFLPEVIAQANPLGIPIGAFIGNMMKRTHEEKVRAETAQKRLYGTTGVDYRMFGESEVGYTSEQMNELAAQGAQASGSRRNLSSVTQGAAFAEKGFSLDRSTVISMFRDMRVGTSNMDVIQNAAAVIRAMPELKHDPKFEEILNLESQIIQKSAETVEKVDRAQAISEIVAFRGVDSKFFSDPKRFAAIRDSIDQSLKSPQNDFAQARNFAILSQIKPQASYFDMIEMQSRGLAQGGFLQKSLEYTQRMLPGKEAQMTAYTGAQYGGGGLLNLAPEVARALVEAFDKKPDLFKEFKGSEADIIAKLTKETGYISARGAEATTEIEKKQVKVSDAFAKEGGVAGMKEILKQTGQELIDSLYKNRESLTMHTPLGNVDLSKELIKIISSFGGKNLVNPYGEEKQYVPKTTDTQTGDYLEFQKKMQENLKILNGDTTNLSGGFNNLNENLKTVGDTLSTVNKVMQEIPKNFKFFNDSLQPAQQ